MRSGIIVTVLLALSAPVSAQDMPPLGELPPGHPPIGPAMPEGEPGQEVEPVGPHAEDQPGEADGDGQAAVPPGHMQIPGMGGESRDRARQDASLPRGTVVAEILDPSGQPVSGAQVELGILAGSSRERRRGQSDASGEARWEGLQPSTQVSYRVMVPHEGARYSSEPFQLIGQHGYRVTVTRYPVTQSTDGLLLFVLRTITEFAEEGDRLRVTQHLQFTNFSESAIVAPPEGIRMPLPTGYRAFHAEDAMGDQRLREGGGGIVIEGSLPPGQTMIAYAFDLGLGGSELTYEQRIPFRLVVAEVLSERAPGMRMSVEGMSEPEEKALGGQTFLATRLSRRPQSPAFNKLRIHLENLPTAGSGRWVALGLAVLAIISGLSSLFWVGDRRAVQKAARRAERDRLVAEGVRIEEERQRGRIDDTAHARMREQIVTRIAEVMYLEDQK